MTKKLRPGQPKCLLYAGAMGHTVVAVVRDARMLGATLTDGWRVSVECDDLHSAIVDVNEHGGGMVFKRTKRGWRREA